MVKKLFIAVGALIILAIIGLTVAPYFIDINKKVKPILVEALEKNLKAKVKMGDISLSLYGKVNLKIDSLKIIKDKMTIDINDLSMMMPYSVLTENPGQWTKKIKMSITADEIALNDRLLVIKKFKSDLLKEDSVIKLKDTKFKVFDGHATSFAEADFTDGLKGSFEFQVKNGKWPADELKASLAKEAAIIPKAEDMISKLQMDNRFEALSGDILFDNGLTTIRSISMSVPQNKADLKAEGTINANNQVDIRGNFFLPLENVPGELRAADGRGRIPFEILGSVEHPQINWQKTIKLVANAYSKDEGKKIIRKEVDKLKEKLMKNEKIKELIKGIKF